MGKRILVIVQLSVLGLAYRKLGMTNTDQKKDVRFIKQSPDRKGGVIAHVSP